VAASESAAAREAMQLEQLGRLTEAITAYERLLARAPNLPDCWYNLALLQRRTGDYPAALASYAQALAHGINGPEEAHLNRGVIFSDCLNDTAAAQRELEAALALNPAYLPALQNLANLHEDLGRREEARATYQRLLALQPHSFEALSRLAGLSDIAGPADPMIADLRRALADPAAGAADRASLGFALARCLDACGQYPAAFAAARDANAASRASAPAAVRYDRAAHERLVDELIRVFPQVPTAASADEAAPAPLFICGMFRSGSTLTERLLSARPEVAPGGELELIPRLAHTLFAPFPAAAAGVPPDLLEQAAARYRAELARVFPGARWVTDKRPDNFLYLGLIRRLFPRARIVHTTRDALDNCLSIYFLHLDQRMSYALDLADIGHYYRQYRRLMGHWRRVCGSDLMDFNYDDFVRDPRREAQRLFEFCGVPWDETCLDLEARRGGAVKTASVWQVRRGVYRHASGRARHYARELEPLVEALAGMEQP